MKNAVVTPTGGVSAVTLSNAGYGYLSTAAAPSVQFKTDGLIDKVTVLTGGTGYTQAPVVTINDPTGVGATATAAVDSNNRVVSVTVTNRGYGYTNPTISLAGPGTGATFSVSVKDTIQEEGGEAPTGHAVLSGGPITAITVANGGAGYTTPPTVSIIAQLGDSVDRKSVV